MKKVLVILPFDNIYPSTNGGMLRCINILNQFSLYFDVSVIINQDINSFSKSFQDFPSLAGIKIYSSANKKLESGSFFLKLKNAVKYRIIRRSLKGPADSNLLRYYNVLKKTLIAEKFDLIIPDTHSALFCVPILKRLNPAAHIMLNAHNVEVNLAIAAFKNNRISKGRLKQINDTDRNLYKTVNSIICCSENDKQEFLKLNKEKVPVYVVPNGTNISPEMHNDTVLQDYPKQIIFCGSLWSIPNAEGIYWFVNDVLPLIKLSIPDIQLLVVGAGKLPEKYMVREDKNILMVGLVPETSSWYNKAALSIVPLLTGSGTRLKILEAMSFGVPVVSTSLGAEGIVYNENVSIKIADDSKAFADVVIKLLSDKIARTEISAAGRKIVEKYYDWNTIGTSLKRIIDNNVTCN